MICCSLGFDFSIIRSLLFIRKLYFIVDIFSDKDIIKMVDYLC